MQYGDLAQPVFHLFDKGRVGSPLGVPQTGGGVHGCGDLQFFEGGPQGVEIGVGKVAILKKHGANKGTAKAGDGGDALQFFNGEIKVLQGDHRRGKEALGGG